MNRTITRRALLGGTLLGAAALGTGFPLRPRPASAAPTAQLLPSAITLPEPFRRPLPVPKVLCPSHSDGAADYYTITQRPVTTQLVPGHRTTLWTYNGSFPGPTIESRTGRPVVIRHVNRLPVPTVVHLHGGRTPHDSDGYPIDFVYPIDRTFFAQHRSPGGEHIAGDTRAGSRVYTYPMSQRAATLWYHDHRMDFTGPAVWRGLAGFHLIRDDEEAALRLPSGAREIPLMLADRSFAADGSLAYPSLDASLTHTPGVEAQWGAGVLGDVMLVNGVPWPTATVDGAYHRLRILNAGNARRLSLRLDPAPPEGFVQIGTDGGLLAEPIRHDHLEVAPAQRYDVLVDFSRYPPGTRVFLVNDDDTGPMSKVMRFVVGKRVTDRFRVPARLSTVERLRAAGAARTRAFAFHAGTVHGGAGWLVGDAPFSPDHVSADPKLGTVEVWRFSADIHHPVHMHLNPFQVLGRGSGGPGPFDAGWQDTILLHPGEQATVAVRFDGYPGRYVFHCHNLEHEDMGMMANFDVRP